MKLTQPFRLYFFHRRGCHWCEKARPEADAFIKTSPGALLVPINVDARPGGVKGFAPNGTPGYLIVVGEEPLDGDVGYKSRKELAEWVEAVLAEDLDEGPEDVEELTDNEEVAVP